MAISKLPLSYCTNVHPGRSLAEVDHGLDEYTAPLRTNFGSPLAAGLWLAAPVVGELLAKNETLPAFRDGLARRGLSCHTLNAFPYGDFHSRRVKENVYLPDWSADARLSYTIDCARVLSALLAPGVEGSISTVPLAFKQFPHASDHLPRCRAMLLQTASALERLYLDTGRLIRLAIEPEPFCLLETTDEVLEFFQGLWTYAESERQLAAVREHLGLCFDICHQAVEFEEMAQSIARLDQAGIRINKVHITCAIELAAPGENHAGREALAAYVEERYLHQTLARMPDGTISRCVDLTRGLALDPPPEFREACAWRIHFHVPVDAERLGPLATTRGELQPALAAIGGLDYAPHLEVETYTWEVLPDSQPAAASRPLVEGLTRELVATRELLKGLASV